MGNNSPSKQRYWDRTRLQWAPVLRAVREFAIASRKAPREEGQSLRRDPSVRQAALNLTAAVQTWHSEWSAYRITSGKGFKTPQGPSSMQGVWVFAETGGRTDGKGRDPAGAFEPRA